MRTSPGRERHADIAMARGMRASPGLNYTTLEIFPSTHSTVRTSAPPTARSNAAAAKDPALPQSPPTTVVPYSTAAAADARCHPSPSAAVFFSSFFCLQIQLTFYSLHPSFTVAFPCS
ncbi:hypothetical protein VNO80_03242 [Phaseolus coccineus]|uniref:Uncharacterized protein n=1 Tax=Phaseolus coccineus TaxID=3886 RepID=A0AAN9RIN4_PHACN